MIKKFYHLKVKNCEEIVHKKENQVSEMNLKVSWRSVCINNSSINIRIFNKEKKDSKSDNQKNNNQESRQNIFIKFISCYQQIRENNK